MRAFALILTLTCAGLISGCNLGKTSEERYTARMERLRNKQEKIGKQMDELTRKEADRRRATMTRQAAAQKKPKAWWKFWDRDKPATPPEQRPWWQTDAKNRKDDKSSTDRPNLLFKPQKSQ